MKLAASPVSPPVTPRLEKETRSVELDLDTLENDDKVGTPSVYSCPDCGGVLWELVGDDQLRFRCRVGHSYTAAALAGEQDAQAETALWAAFRNLEEHASFGRRLAARARRAGHPLLADRFLTRAEEASRNAATIREMIVRLQPAADADVPQQ